jgi:hypothetical protein
MFKFLLPDDVFERSSCRSIEPGASEQKNQTPRLRWQSLFRKAHSLDRLLCSLELLSIAFTFEGVTGTFAGRTQSIEPLLLGCFGLDDFANPHESIY